jgi:hypothetical protein
MDAQILLASHPENPRVPDGTKKSEISGWTTNGNTVVFSAKKGKS